MSSERADQPATPDNQPPVHGVPGQVLAAQREAMGWSVEQVADQLKLAVRQVIALEAGDYASLPSPAVTRGFVRAYAKLVKLEVFNPQAQPKIVWPASFFVSRAYLDQLERNQGLNKDRLSEVKKELKNAEKKKGAEQADALRKLAGELDQDAQGAVDPARVKLLASSVNDLAAATH